MQALISPNEIVTNSDATKGYRVAQVENQPFEVATPLFWTTCSDECKADIWFYDTATNQCAAKPIPLEPSE